MSLLGTIKSIIYAYTDKATFFFIVLRDLADRVSGSNAIVVWTVLTPNVKKQKQSKLYI